jgi:hypothetical protein
MGKGTRQTELQQRRHRQLKRRKQRRHHVLQLLEQAKTREERLRLIREVETSQPRPASTSVASS